MATHSHVLAWRIPWMRNLAGRSPRGHKESDTTEATERSGLISRFPGGRWGGGWAQGSLHTCVPTRAMPCSQRLISSEQRSVSLM